MRSMPPFTDDAAFYVESLQLSRNFTSFVLLFFMLRASASKLLQSTIKENGGT